MMTLVILSHEKHPFVFLAMCFTQFQLKGPIYLSCCSFVINHSIYKQQRQTMVLCSFQINAYMYYFQSGFLVMIQKLTFSVFFQKSVLTNLIQEIEPLDVSLIQKDVPPTTVDAIKRTISGMLGLLPSDRFQVFIEALWEPLSKLLVSSMMTGYVLILHDMGHYNKCFNTLVGCQQDETLGRGFKSPCLL